jgi:ABC-2 type transport system ATP-binding protein
MKCELIAALIHSPKVLFLDEPTIGLDVVMQKNLRDFIREYNKKYNSTIILTSHYMKDVEQLCKRIIVIDHGNILYDGSLEDIIKKYAKHKLLTVQLSQKVEREKFKDLGEIIRYEYPKVTLSVLREKSNIVATKLLQKFPVEDLNVEDISIEEVIRDVFSEIKK